MNDVGCRLMLGLVCVLGAQAGCASDSTSKTTPALSHQVASSSIPESSTFTRNDAIVVTPDHEAYSRVTLRETPEEHPLAKIVPWSPLPEEGDTILAIYRGSKCPIAQMAIQDIPNRVPASLKLITVDHTLLPEKYRSTLAYVLYHEGEPVDISGGYQHVDNPNADLINEARFSLLLRRNGLLDSSPEFDADPWHATRGVFHVWQEDPDILNRHMHMDVDWSGRDRRDLNFENDRFINVVLNDVDFSGSTFGETLMIFVDLRGARLSEEQAQKIHFISGFCPDGSTIVYEGEPGGCASSAGEEL